MMVLLRLFCLLVLADTTILTPVAFGYSRFTAPLICFVRAGGSIERSATASQSCNKSATVSHRLQQTSLLASPNQSGGSSNDESTRIASADLPPNALNLWISSPSTLVFTGIAAAFAFCRSPAVVPRSDVVFSIAYPAYLAVANRLRFDRNAPVVAAEKELRPLLREGRGPWFKTYVTFFGTIGIILPVLVQLVAPRSVADAAAPHLFLTLCQVVTESLHRGSGSYALVRLLVPVGFNAYRMRTLWIWTGRAWGGFSSVASSNVVYPPGLPVAWELFSLALATTNLVAWAYNLFIFLLLRVSPQYLDRRELPQATVVWKNQLFPVVEKAEAGSQGK